MNTAPTRLFLDWIQPAGELVAQRIIALQEPSALLVVPTKESARMLKEQLAMQSAKAEGQGACLSPRIISSNQLLAQFKPQSHRAVEELFCWMECLSEPQNRDLALFSASKHWKTQSWLYQAKQFCDIFSQLSRDGVDWQHPQLREFARDDASWQSLLALKAQQVKKLTEYVPHSQPVFHPAPTRIILACVPQLSVEQQNLLSALDCPVELWIHAPERYESRFDAWGRPLSSWIAPIEGKDAQDWLNTIHLCKDGWDMAQRAVHQVGIINAQEGGKAHSVALCHAEPSMEASLEERFSFVGVELHRPRGYSMRSSSWYHLLTQLLQLNEQLEHMHIARSEYENYPCSIITELLNNPQLGFFLLGDDFLAKAERQSFVISRIQSRCFPTRLKGLIHELGSWTAHYPRERDYETDAQALRGVILKLAEWLELALSSGQSLVEQVRALIFASSKHLSFQQARQLSYTESINTLCEQSLELTKGRDFSCDWVLSFLLTSCENKRCTPKRSNEAKLDIMGWRDLVYSSAKNLVVTGFHDSVLPEKWGTESWLTPTVRKKLHLCSDEDYAAHDCYLLQSLIASKQGRIHLYLCQFDSQANPLAPSSLLFSICSQDMLPALILKLFPENNTQAELQDDNVSLLPWQYSQISNPKQIEITAENLVHAKLSDFGIIDVPISVRRGFSPSMLKDYLSCPLRFWLKRIHRIDREELKARKRELNSMDLGNLIHEALEIFILRYPDYASFCSAQPDFPYDAGQLDSSHIPAIELALIQSLDSCYKKHYPHQSLVPQQLQYSCIELQLRSYAGIHLELWKEGWYTPRDAQGKLLVEYKPDWVWEGYRMNVKIDRIDCRVINGNLEMRVIDYKTGKVESCEKQHLRKVAKTQDAQENYFCKLSPHFDLVTSKSRKDVFRWGELQLPLYAAWVEQNYPEATLSAAYVRLSNKVESNALLLWDALEKSYGLFEHQGQYFCSAKAWILGCMQLISEGKGLITAELMGQTVPYDTLFGDIAKHAPLHEQFFQAPQH